ncbi:MAG: pyruvate kinase [Verrucomicrobia bacterium]|nr:pyruvate kinase [Verrucomicrobiota bacterium]
MSVSKTSAASVWQLAHARRTKLIATLGPKHNESNALSQLIDAGAEIFRLNMSHANHDFVRQVTPKLRSLASNRGQEIALLLDTQGPAIRTGTIGKPRQLAVGDELILSIDPQASAPAIPVNYPDLVRDLSPGQKLLVDNGVIHLQVLKKDSTSLLCRVLTAGTLGDRRHINLPGIRVNLPAITEKDAADLLVGLEAGIDWVALSFVRDPDDVIALRDFLDQHNGRNVKIIAKIEDQLAVKNILGIISAADAIMVARGDLGVECPYEELPIIQRRILKQCITAMKPVIVATHMLESMISNPLPTRAEITDVANAVFEGADAIMLSGETATGQYPRACLEVLDRVARRIERSGSIGYERDIHTEGEADGIVSSGVHLANELGAQGILLFTRTGRMARVAAALRPRFSPIYAFTPTPTLARQLSLHYGVRARCLPFDRPERETVIQEVIGDLLLKGWVHPHAPLVIVNTTVVGDKTYRTVQARTAQV